MELNWNYLKSKIVTAVAFAAAGLLLPMSQAGAEPITGGTTTVVLDTTTFTTLTTTLGFSITAIAPATVSTSPLEAVFPITGGDTTTVIDHSGGLSFTKSGTTANIDDFIINLNTGILSGTLTAGGSSMSGLSFFDLSASNVLTVDPALAGILSSAYGVPNLSGATIGTADVSLSPEPADAALVGLGLLLLALSIRNRARRRA